MDRMDTLEESWGCFRFGTECPIGTPFNKFSAKDLGVPGEFSIGDDKSLSDLMCESPPSDLARKRNKGFGDSMCTKDGRLLWEVLEPRLRTGSGNTNFSDNGGLIGQDTASAFSVDTGLFDPAEASEISRDESIPK
mmetsp:Transcript_3484/g.7638  ORF Transcript_3484/g.7638 Transcript_3484/m.7638 type:complete len:136 (+) Transcript_3484:894-1301(+)